MKVLRVYWVGTRTDEFDATVDFFRSVLGLAAEHAEDDFAILHVADGATVEVFGPTSRYNAHVTSPVVGFLVEDLAAAEQELLAAGTPIVLPRSGGEARSWLHFRAPDGHVYELVQSANEVLDLARQADPGA